MRKIRWTKCQNLKNKDNIWPYICMTLRPLSPTHPRKWGTWSSSCWKWGWNTAQLSVLFRNVLSWKNYQRSIIQLRGYKRLFLLPPSWVIQEQPCMTLSNLVWLWGVTPGPVFPMGLAEAFFGTAKQLPTHWYHQHFLINILHVNLKGVCAWRFQLVSFANIWYYLPRRYLPSCCM